MSLLDANIVPALAPGEAHLWWIQASDAMSRAGRSLLTAEEIERAERLRVPRTKDEFIVGRAVLRALVGMATGTAAGAVRFEVGAQGKLAVPDVEFNVTHSRGLVGIALCREVEIGVDIEAMDRQIETLEIAKGSFSREEIAEIEGASDSEQRILTFYRIWTRKEAVLKAHGHGLIKSLDGFSVSSRWEKEQQVFLDRGTKGQRTFFVREIIAKSGFMGAFAASVPGLSLRTWTLDAGSFARLISTK